MLVKFSPFPQHKDSPALVAQTAFYHKIVPNKVLGINSLIRYLPGNVKEVVMACGRHEVGMEETIWRM